MLGSYLIQFPLQRGHLPGIGEGDVQSRGDGVDELDVVLFSRRYQRNELFCNNKETL